jgi:hypothetical protein
MSTINDGGPVFPTTEAHGFNQGEPGITARDYFAAKAMQAMIAKSSGQDTTGGKAGVPLVARYAYEYADAMLAERVKVGTAGTPDAGGTRDER